jgi:hypothetical protein
MPDLSFLLNAIVVVGVVYLANAGRDLAREVHVDGKTRIFAKVVVAASALLAVQAILLFCHAGSPLRFAAVDVEALAELKTHAKRTALLCGVVFLEVGVILFLGASVLRAMSAAALEQRMDLVTRQQLAEAGK